MIDRSTVDRIFDTARIEEVVGDYVSLKKRGVNMIGLCPFHDEKTPSFTVSPSKGICKCFGCGKGGNPVNFLMELEQLSYVEALRTLAKKYHIDIEEEEESDEQKAQRNERESMLIVSELAAKYFNHQLSEQEGKTVGLSYFLQRGFTEKTISTYQLGYSPASREAFTKYATAKGYKKDYLVKTGITIEREGRVFDRFSGRVMFPIHNLTGKVIGFGGRILKTDAKAAKYLNSPESEIYHKSNILYGIYQAKQSIVKNDQCIMVEGYTDVMSLHQAGLHNVVASSGTALTPNQIRLVKRFTENMLVIYDGDAAGIKASLRGIDLILEQGMNVRVLLLPDGEDPDSFAQKHSATELENHINTNKQDFIRFKTQILLKDAANDPIKKAGLVSDIVKSIKAIPDAIKRSVYIKECSNMLGIPEDVLYTEVQKRMIADKESRQKERDQKERMEKFRKKESLGQEPPPDMFMPDDGFTGPPSSGGTSINQMPAPVAKPKVSPFQNEEHAIIRVLVRYGNHKMYHEDEPEYEEHGDLMVSEFILDDLEYDAIEFQNPVYNKIYTDYKANTSPEFEPEKFFSRHEETSISTEVATMVAEQHQISKLYTDTGSHATEDELLRSIVPKVLLNYKLKVIEFRVKEVQAKFGQPMNDQERQDVFQEFTELNEIRKQISHHLGRT